MNFISMTGIIILGYFFDKFDVSDKIIFFLNILKNDCKIEKEEKDKKKKKKNNNINKENKNINSNSNNNYIQKYNVNNSAGYNNNLLNNHLNKEKEIINQIKNRPNNNNNNYNSNNSSNIIKINKHFSKISTTINFFISTFCFFRYFINTFTIIFIVIIFWIWNKSR